MRLVIILLGLGLLMHGKWTRQSSFTLSSNDEYELYSDRPDILTLKPSPMVSVEIEWDAYRPAHIEALAMLVELYPDRDIYFLARDGELFYDLAKVLFRNQPKMLEKMHLINVSRMNMKDENLGNYLAQVGISEEVLRAGKKVVLFDTGFSGQISQKIGSLFSDELSQNIETHLVVSQSVLYPSMRTFFVHINPNSYANPSNSMRSLEDYELIARYTDRSTAYNFINGRWEPIITAGARQDGTVSKDLSVLYQKDLLWFGNTITAQAHFHERREIWAKLYGLGKENKRTELVELLKSLVSAKKKQYEAIVLDFVDVIRKNQIFSHDLDISLTELGFGFRIPQIPSVSNRPELIKKYPQWVEILESPASGIVEMLEEGKIKEIVEVFYLVEEEVGEQRFRKDVFKTIRDRLKEEGNDLLVALVSKRDKGLMVDLMSQIFYDPGASKNQKYLYPVFIEFIDVLKEMKELDLFGTFAANVFGNYKMSQRFVVVKAYIDAAVEMKSSKLLDNLITYSFKGPPHSDELIDYFLGAAIDLKDHEPIKTMINDWSFGDDVDGRVFRLLEASIFFQQEDLIATLDERIAWKEYLISDSLNSMIKGFLADKNWQNLEKSLKDYEKLPENPPFCRDILSKAS